ncbi:nucleoside-triphosphatase [Gudongella sp. SC589]|uniref:nucleoside-triphosphatase n=1 Tax=Gudongella sp. SC589 TaxID=3385990 RepID=UPI00390476D3
MGRVHIITGGWDTGKTTSLIKHYKDLGEGTADGFASIKTYDDTAGDFLGYTLMRLGTGEHHSLARLKKDFSGNLDGYIEFDRFIFLEGTFVQASKIIEELLEDRMIERIFLDEIGPIELEGFGFHKILVKMLKSDKDIYLVVNEHKLQDVTKKYEIEKYIKM